MSRRRWRWFYILVQGFFLFVTLGGIPTSLQQWAIWFDPIRSMLESFTAVQMVAGAGFLLTAVACIWDLRYGWRGMPWARQVKEPSSATLRLTNPSYRLESRGATEVRHTIDGDHWITKQSLVAWLMQSDTVRRRASGPDSAERGRIESPEEQRKASAYRIIWEFQQAYPHGVREGAYNRALFHGWLERESNTLTG